MIRKRYDVPAYILSHDARPHPVYAKFNVIALSLTRDLGRNGVPVIRFHPNSMDSSLYSRYCTAVQSPNVSAEKELLSFLTAYSMRCADRGVLFPASDDCLEFINKYQQELRKYYILPMAAPEVINIIFDKKRQYEQAVAADIGIPETYFPANAQEMNEVSNRIYYPAVIKPLIAHHWRTPLFEEKLKVGKAIVVRDRQEAMAAYQKIAAVDGYIMFQEILQSRVEDTITVLCYYNRDSELVAYSMREKMRQYPLNFGYCCLTKSRNIPAVKELANRFLRYLHYVGIAGIEFKLDPKDNTYKLMEINARPFQTIGLAAATGVNIPLIAYLDSQGLYEQVQTLSFRENVTWIYLDKEFDMLRLLLKNKRTTVWEWLRNFRGEKTFADFAWDDWRPFLSLLYWKVREAMSGRFKLLHGEKENG